MKRAAGFTLIEMMVTLTVMAILMMAGVPFARGWIDGNRQMQARNLMWEAVSQARALALRNPGEAVAGQISARLERSGDRLQVLRAGSDDALWTGDLPDGASTKLADAGGDVYGDLSCVAFDNRGQRVTAGADCATGGVQARIAIGFGSQEALYVDLL